MKINKHGLKMTGLKEAAGNTGGWTRGSGGYTEIFYDRLTGEIWTIQQCSRGHNSWTQYADADVMKICETEEHLTMQEIADRIAEMLNDIEDMLRLYESVSKA